MDKEKQIIMLMQNPKVGIVEREEDFFGNEVALITPLHNQETMLFDLHSLVDGQTLAIIIDESTLITKEGIETKFAHQIINDCLELRKSRQVQLPIVIRCHGSSEDGWMTKLDDLKNFCQDLEIPFVWIMNTDLKDQYKKAGIYKI